MPSAYLRGCERVTCIVERNVSFREIVLRKAPEDLRDIATEPQLDRRAEAFCRHLRLRLSKILQYKTEKSDLLLFGKTHNNRREFEFLLQLLRGNGVVASSRLFLDDFPSKRVANSVTANEILERVSVQTHMFVAQRNLGAAHLWQLLQYAVNFISIRASYGGRELQNRPRVAVVANDHSPAQVAFKAAMEELDVPVIYIQHAEVSPAFPPLDYAVNILRNQVSLDVYKQTGPLRGETFILSRNKGHHNLKQVVNTSMNRLGRAVVGIYPTSRFDPQNVGEFLRSLESNPAIENFFVKLHPNSATTLSQEELARYRVRTDIPTEPHIAIVGNSSVATELLVKGVPVYQLFNLDEVDRDYYGFVAGGLTKEIKPEQLGSDAFWNDGFFDETWLARAAKFEPSVNSDQKTERARVAKYFSRHFLRAPQVKQSTVKRLLTKLLTKLGFRKSNRTDVTATQWQASMLDQADDQLRLADALLSTATDAKIRENTIAWFQARWADRDERAFKLVRNAAAAQVPPSDPWLRLLPHELMSIPIEQHAAAELVDDIMRIANPPARRIYELAAMRVLLKNNLIGEFNRLLDRSPVYKIETLGSNFKIELARRLSNRTDTGSAEQLTTLLASLSPYERTRIHSHGAILAESLLTHEILEREFLATMAPSVAQQFAATIKPAYDQMRSRMRYMDIRTDMGQRQALRQRIVDALDRQLPFSLVRLGDGEAYLFDPSVGPFTEADRQMRERHWWNISLPREIRTQLRAKSLMSIQKADVVGIPSIHRFFRDYSPKSQNFLSSTANRGIVTSVLGAASQAVGSDFTEDRAHHILFDKPWLKELLANASRIVVVSSIREKLVREHLATNGNIEVIEIPTHAKTKMNPMFVDWTKPLPLELERIEERLRLVLRKGDLVLVSAGVAGKGLIGLAKDAGAVGLDLGGQIEPLLGLPGGAMN